MRFPTKDTSVRASVARAAVFVLWNLESVPIPAPYKPLQAVGVLRSFAQSLGRLLSITYVLSKSLRVGTMLSLGESIVSTRCDLLVL